MSEGNEKTRFLPSIANALAAVQQQGDEITTVAIANLFDSIILIFDYLGPVLHFAKHDMHSKCESLKKASGQYATLRALVDAGAVRFSMPRPSWPVHMTPMWHRTLWHLCVQVQVQIKIHHPRSPLRQQSRYSHSEELVRA